MPLTKQNHRGTACGMVMLLCGILSALGTVALADCGNTVDANSGVGWTHYFARILQCQFPIPMEYEVLLRSLDDGAISFANGDLLTGGSIKLSKYVENQNSERLASDPASKDGRKISVGPLSVYIETLQLSPNLKPTDYVRITDTKEEVVLIGQAAGYWESMVSACIETMGD